MKATIIIAAVTGLALGGIAGAAPVYLTNFPKTANLANNLNQQYPNTGFTAGGSATGNPNVSVLYDPATYTSPNIVPAGNFVTNGITFTIASDALGHDYSELVGTSVTVPVNAVGVSSLHLLLGAYFGVNASVTLTGAAGGSQTFAPFFVPDFNGGGPAIPPPTADSSSNPSCRSTVSAAAAAVTPPTAPSTTTSSMNTPSRSTPP